MECLRTPYVIFYKSVPIHEDSATQMSRPVRADGWMRSCLWVLPSARMRLVLMDG
jgi:hypothetical protein